MKVVTPSKEKEVGVRCETEDTKKRRLCGGMFIYVGLGPITRPPFSHSDLHDLHGVRDLLLEGSPSLET